LYIPVLRSSAQNFDDHGRNAEFYRAVPVLNYTTMKTIEPSAVTVYILEPTDKIPTI